MKLLDFFEKQNADMIAFYEWYVEQHKNNPERFPIDMEYGDWVEQFLLFSPDEMKSDTTQDCNSCKNEMSSCEHVTDMLQGKHDESACPGYVLRK